MDDSETRELMEDVASVVKSFVGSALSPIVARLDAIEKRFAELPPPFALDAGEVRGLARTELADDIGQVRGLVGALMSPDQIRALCESLVAAQPKARDGKDADPAAIAALVDEAVRTAVAAIPPAEPGKDGTSVTLADVAPMIAARVAETVAAMPPVEAKEVDPALVERLVCEEVAKVPPAEPGKSITVEDVAPLLYGLVRDAVAQIPPAKPGEAADPEKIAEILRATLGNELAAALDDKLRDAVAAIPAAKDGVDGTNVTLADVEPMLREMVDALPVPKDGISVTIDDVRPLVEEAVAKAVAAIPVPRDGKDGMDGKDGKLPIVKAWADQVHYEGDVRTHRGSTYQALRDTGREPPHEDWTCLASGGADGRSFTVRGTYEADGAYAALDVVVLNGAAFAARRDDPGSCPGEGWQMIAMQGKPGKPGPAMKGDPGPPGPSIVSMSIDDQGLLTLTNGDGSTVECDLYPLLAKLA